jgi:hypothetical protein
MAVQYSTSQLDPLSSQLSDNLVQRKSIRGIQFWSNRSPALANTKITSLTAGLLPW